MPEQGPPDPGLVCLQRTQRAFTAHIRDPDAVPAPAGIEDRRMHIYRELVHNNVASLLRSSFPLLHRLLPDRAWQRLVREFLARHRCRTPLFTELAQEFIDFLGREHQTHADDPPFLLELAHYEWVAMALRLSDAEIDATGVDPNGEPMDGIPVLSPLAWPLSYRFPVHRIGPDHRPTEPPPQPTHLLVYRNRQDRVEFMAINVVTRRLLQLMDAPEPRTGRAMLAVIAAELGHRHPRQVIEGGRQLLADLRRRDVVVGIRRGPDPR